jgi:hypothetical protein
MFEGILVAWWRAPDVDLEIFADFGSWVRFHRWVLVPRLSFIGQSRHRSEHAQQPHSAVNP